MPSLGPSDAADLEIGLLHSRPEFQSECVFGCAMPADMIERNKQKQLAFRKARAEIIAKHGVFDEYMVPLLEEEARLLSELDATRSEIETLRMLRSKK